MECALREMENTTRWGYCEGNPLTERESVLIFPSNIEPLLTNVLSRPKSTLLILLRHTKYKQKYQIKSFVFFLTIFVNFSIWNSNIRKNEVFFHANCMCEHTLYYKQNTTSLANYLFHSKKLNLEKLSLAGKFEFCSGKCFKMFKTCRIAL